MTRLSASKAHDEFAAVLERVASTKERIVLYRQGKNMAALVSMDDVALLEELEDHLDVLEAERRLSDPSEKPIPYEVARKDMGLA